MNRRNVLLAAAALPLAAISTPTRAADIVTDDSVKEYLGADITIDELRRLFAAMETIIYLVSLSNSSASEKLLEDQAAFFALYGALFTQPVGVEILKESLLGSPDRVTDNWKAIVLASMDLQTALATVVTEEAQKPLIKAFARSSALIFASTKEKKPAWWCQFYGLRAVIKYCG